MPKPQEVAHKTRLVKIRSSKDNFDLTKAEFNKYLANLKTGDDSFITEVLANQLPESMSYLKNKFRTSHEKAYDVCLDAFLVFRDKLINDKIKYGNLRFLFTRICVNQFIDEKKRNKKVEASIQEFLKSQNHTSTSDEFFFLKLDAAVIDLAIDQQHLIREIYYSGKTMNTIAEENGISYASLRKKKERILKRIKKYFFSSTEI